MTELRESQRSALGYVQEKAIVTKVAARRKAASVLQHEGVSIDVFDAALIAIKKNAPIDVNFHPDRLTPTGASVSEVLLQSGRYRNQFETGISNGGLTAFEGGARDIWEKRLFGGMYQQPGVLPADRPKYGALNLLRHWDGACPRFGCCYFRLKSSVAERCTFAFGDSSTQPDVMGTISVFDSVLAAVLEAIQTTGAALGGRNLRVGPFLAQLILQAERHGMVDFSRLPGRSLDESIEVHIHGPVRLECDIACLVADRAFRCTTTGAELEKLSAKYDFPLYWTPGFYLPISEVPANFRGPIMVPLAKHIAPDGVLDVVKIGAATVALRRNPGSWSEWGSFDETLQYLKQMWHILATFGRIGTDVNSRPTGPATE